MPLYVVTNKAPFTIEIQEAQRPGDKWLEIESEQCIPFWPKSDDNRVRIKVKHDGHVSPSFDYTEAHSTLLRLNNKVRPQQYSNLRYDITSWQIGNPF